ncbi:SID1 transmembrane family member 2 isoform 17-T17 [Alca torda]
MASAGAAALARALLAWALVALSPALPQPHGCRKVVEKEASFDTTYADWVDADLLNIYAFNHSVRRNWTEGVRVSVNVLSDHKDLPVLFVVRQKEAVVSFQVPLILRGLYQRKYAYQEVSRTLCQPQTKAEVETQHFYVDVSTLSLNASYQLRVTRVENFVLQTNERFGFNATAAQPQYFKYEFPEGVDSVIVKVTSAMAFPCSVISIQDILVGLGGGTSIWATRDARRGLTTPLPPQCPVYDLDNNVAFIGMYQTMTKKAAITVQKKDFPSNSFYVVVVVKTEDEACGGALPYYPLSKHASPGTPRGMRLRMRRRAASQRAEPPTQQRRGKHSRVPSEPGSRANRPPCLLPDEPVDQHNRQKMLEVMVSPAITSEAYVSSVLFCLGIFLSFYVLTLVIACWESCRQQKRKGLLAAMDSPSLDTASLLGHARSIPDSFLGRAPYDSYGYGSFGECRMPSLPSPPVLGRPCPPRLPVLAGNGSSSSAEGVTDSLGSAEVSYGYVGERSLENVAGRPRLDSLSSIEEDDYDTLADIDYDKNVIRTKVRPALRPLCPPWLLPAGRGEPFHLPLLPAIPLRGRPGPQGQAGAAEEVPDLLLEHRHHRCLLRPPRHPARHHLPDGRERHGQPGHLLLQLSVRPPAGEPQVGSRGAEGGWASPTSRAGLRRGPGEGEGSAAPASGLSPRSAFNNILSNLGYVLLGLLFLLIILQREINYNRALMRNDAHALECGIPKHFGLFYAMGTALMMEGLLSACYHVCPNYTNFQFDTSFMYMIAGLCMLKLYQKRHPDINASAYSAYACLALVIFFSVVGVVFGKGNTAFWIVFSVIHIVATLLLSTQLYYMGRWKLDSGILRRILHVLYTDCVRQCSGPMYVDRMVLLVMGNIINWSLAAYGLIVRPNDFASYLLAIGICNLLLYFAFYIIMKVRTKPPGPRGGCMPGGEGRDRQPCQLLPAHRPRPLPQLRSGERIKLIPLLCIVGTSVVWGFALFFFFQGLSTWQVRGGWLTGAGGVATGRRGDGRPCPRQKTPAESREHNRDCILLDFFDDHDIWHFLSSIAMFGSFLVGAGCRRRGCPLPGPPRLTTSPLPSLCRCC